MAAVKLPFRRLTRQQWVEYAGQQWQDNSRITFILNKVGLLNMLVLRIRGYIRRASTDTNHAGPLWQDFIHRLTVSTNQFATTLVDVSGLGLATIQEFLERGYGVLGFGGVTDGLSAIPAVFDFDLNNSGGSFAPPGGGTAVYPINLQFFIPIAANEGRNFETGLINLQANELQVTVTVNTGSLVDFFPPASTLAGTYWSDSAGTKINGPMIELAAQYYQIPNLAMLDGGLPVGMLHRFSESESVIAGTGDFEYEFPKEGVLMQAAHIIIINGSRNSGLGQSHDDGGTFCSNFRITSNITQRLYEMDRRSAAILWRKRYAKQAQNGTFVWDFWHADQRVSHGDYRDFIDTQRVATLKSIFTVSPTATLGANNNKVRTIRRLLQPLT